MGMENASARGRLERAEDRFTDLTQGAKDLLNLGPDGTRYKFVDGSEVVGVQPAADMAELIVRNTERAMGS